MSNEHVTLIELLVGVYGTVIANRSAVYLSAPVTTGQRFVKWRASLPEDSPHAAWFEAQHQQHVIQPNMVAAREVAQGIRMHFPNMVVIDPTALTTVPGWDQPQYRDLWRRVIEQHVAMVFFVDGWEHSEGCCYEYLVAHDNGIPTFDAKGGALTRERAIELISSAIAARRAAQIETDYIVAIRDKLRDISTPL